MRLERGNLRTRVVEATDKEYWWLYDYLTFKNHRSIYSAEEDKAFYMLERNSESFPSGMLPLVEQDAPEEGFYVEVVDRRGTLPRRLAPDLSWLYDYQRKGVEVALREEVGILWLPTGSGKTEMQIAVAMAVPVRWLIMVPDADLLGQTADRWEKRTGTRAGRVGDGIFQVDRVTVATFQTLYKRFLTPEVRQLLTFAQGVMFDEVHTLPADTFYRVAMATLNARYRLGFSGTPLDRGDQKSVYTISATGPVIYRVKSDLLIDKGRIARPQITMVPVVQYADPRYYTEGGMWSLRQLYQMSYDTFIINSQKRNLALLDICRRAAKPALLFVKEKVHGHVLARLCEEANIPAVFAHAKHKTSMRKSILQAAAAGRLDVVICTNIFKQGVDVPELMAIIRGDAGKSVIEALQKGGRGSRVIWNEDYTELVKDRFEIWDIFDRGHPWFTDQAKKRTRAYAREGFHPHIEEGLFASTAWG